MKFSEQWLREWVNPKITTEQLSEQLTMAGLEVDMVTPAAEEFTNVVVGQVVACAKHPDAERLHVCKVDIGKGEPLDIVCGGVNVRENLKVPVALVGAKLPGDIKIKKAKLRGQASNGMICAGRELGLGEGFEPPGGIMELRDDAPIGVDFREYLALDDRIIDIELTPNRGDCLSLLGIAREIALANEMQYEAPQLQAVSAQHATTFPVKITATKACPRYAGRVITNINPKAQTPIWMQEKLRRSGVRCLHPVVDICNYVMLELGQPMHAFDLAALQAGIDVRFAKAKEKITLLDGSVVELTPQALVIADKSGPQALAGIMGGNDSAVITNTTDIFLESAFFDLDAIRITARQYGLQSDSSYRFARGVDYQLQVSAIERATRLILDIVGGEPGPVIDVVSKADLPGAVEITLRREQIKRLLGIEIPDKQVEFILSALGLDVKKQKDGWQTKVPSYRFDLTQEVDLIEELARIHGYNNIAPQQIVSELDVPQRSAMTLPVERIIQALVDQGYHEVITYSFVDAEHQQFLDPANKPIELANPIASDMAVMRTSLWPGLVQAGQYNLFRQAERVRLFEVGLTFQQQKNEWLQVPKLAMLICGYAQPEQWGVEKREADFFDAKANVEMLLNLTGRAREFSWRVGSHPALHPGQCAELVQNDQIVGHLGALHPKIAQHFGLNQVPLLAEVVLTALTSAQLAKFKPISKFPAVRRDLALLIDRAVTVRAIKRTVENCAGELLQNVKVFDVYQGQGIDTDKKSVALGLIFQDPSRTLVDSEINVVIQNVIAALEQDFNAQLRA